MAGKVVDFQGLAISFGGETGDIGHHTIDAGGYKTSLRARIWFGRSETEGIGGLAHVQETESGCDSPEDKW